MKHKPSEIAFIIACVLIFSVGIVLVAVRKNLASDDIEIIAPENPGTSAYPVEPLNEATAEDFMNVSGIGEVKAGDIIAFRDAIGGFVRAEQIMEISGISDRLFERIIDYFYNDHPAAPDTVGEETSPTAPAVTEAEDPADPVFTGVPQTSSEKKSSSKQTEPEPTEPEKPERQKVDINSATADEIAKALLISDDLAAQIVELRDKIHGFSTVEELYLCEGMTDAIYSEIKNFIVI